MTLLISDSGASPTLAWEREQTEGSLSRFPAADAISFDAQDFRRTLRVVKLTDR